MSRCFLFIILLFIYSLIHRMCAWLSHCMALSLTWCRSNKPLSSLLSEQFSMMYRNSSFIIRSIRRVDLLHTDLAQFKYGSIKSIYLLSYHKCFPLYLQCSLSIAYTVYMDVSVHMTYVTNLMSVQNDCLLQPSNWYGSFARLRLNATFK